MGRGGVVVLSGAGISTDSGIPDYRGPSGAQMRRHAPMTYETFVGDADARRRYWARGFLGWAHMARTRPNAGHRAIADLERVGLVTDVVTQNVDGLHHAAGSRQVVDLHGRLDRVVCLRCGLTLSREAVQGRLRAANAGWAGTATDVNPDGDVELDDGAADRFVVVDCEACGGLLKPDVVYFGERVPPARVAAAASAVDRATSLLVVGSSLHVFSGRRLVLRAVSQGTAVAIVNLGPTRSDDVAQVRLDEPLGPTLSKLADELAA